MRLYIEIILVRIINIKIKFKGAVMFKIGEFSKLTQVSIRMLRYYDEIGLLKPAYVDLYTGYRMYSADQIPSLQKIILLRDSKFNISEIKNIILNNKEIEIINELEKKKIQINKEIEMERRRIEKIDNAIEEIKNNNFEIQYNVNFKRVDKVCILSTRDIIPTYFHEGVLWERLFKFIDKENIPMKQKVYNNIALYHDIEHKDKDVDVEVGVVVDKLGEDREGFIYRELEGVDKMAYAMVYGSYSNLSKAYKALAYYLERNNEVMAEEPSRQICHIGVDDTDNEDNYLTEIQIPLL